MPAVGDDELCGGPISGLRVNSPCAAVGCAGPAEGGNCAVKIVRREINRDPSAATTATIRQFARAAIGGD